MPVRGAALGGTVLIMRCVRSDDLATFAATVLPWLEREPVLNNVLCTVIGERAGGQRPVEPGCLWTYVVDDAGELRGVAIRTPPHDLLVGALIREAAEAIADGLADADVPGVRGPTDGARAFVAAWRARRGVDATSLDAQRMYRLDAVTAPVGVPGRLRAAAEDDVALVARWAHAFSVEAGQPRPPVKQDIEDARRWIAAGGAWLWEIDGAPVSIACDRPRVAGVPRVSLVYTPPEQRRRGYAGACVAALSQLVLDRGAAACMLYTDLANPTSNSVYQKIGYRPFADAEHWAFTDAAKPI